MGKLLRASDDPKSGPNRVQSPCFEWNIGAHVIPTILHRCWQAALSFDFELFWVSESVLRLGLVGQESVPLFMTRVVEAVL
jgi:hypothetical protein